MFRKIVGSVLSVCTFALVGASIFVGLTVTAKAQSDYNGNKTYNSQGVQVGCITYSKPYDCKWSD